MKLLFIVADLTFVGGIERVITNLSNSFSKENINVEILSLYKTNSSCTFSLDESIKLHYLNEDINYNGKPGSITRLLKHIKNIKKLKRYINGNEFNVIISNSFPTSFQVFFTKKKSKWITYEHVHYDYYNFIIKKIRNYIYRKFDHIVVLTNKDEIKFKRFFCNVDTIYNPIGFSSLEQSDVTNNVMIAVGRLEYQKGFDMLIDAYQTVEKENPNWTLKIFGDGSEKNKLEKKIKMLGLKKAHIMGKTDDIKNEMLNSSFLVMSSRFEGFPMVLAEAMECGLPCISFDCPNGPSDIIIDNYNGFLIENGNIEKLAEGVIKLSNSYEQRKKLSINAKNSIKQLALDKITSDWLKII